MLGTFVIGVREGLEAALIVGIVATFLRRHGRPQQVRQMWIGVLVACALCLAVGLLLGTTDLPQRQQEMLETVVGAVAVVMVSFMVLWMKGHSRDLKRNLETSVAAALATGSAWALVLTAFLAVIREGFETAVFLVASVQTTGSDWQSLGGAVLGVAVAVVLGWLIYRGGVRINLSRFFRITGVVLVVVAGGLVMTVLRHAHEADWLNVGQQQVVDVSAAVRPGSVQESLLTGVLGIAARPTAIEVLAWFLYVVPMLAVVLWPARRMPTRRTLSRGVAVAAVAVGVVAAALAVTVPRPSSAGPVTGNVTGRVVAGVELAGGADLTGQQFSVSPAIAVRDHSSSRLTVQLSNSGQSAITTLDISGATADGATYTGTAVGFDPQQTVVRGSVLATANGGRLIGLKAADLAASLPALIATSWTPTVTVAPDGSVVDLRLRIIRTAQVTSSTGAVITAKVLDVTAAATPVTTAVWRQAAQERSVQADRREVWGIAAPLLLGVAAVWLLLLAAARWRRGVPPAAVAPDPQKPSVTSPEPSPENRQPLAAGAPRTG